MIKRLLIFIGFVVLLLPPFLQRAKSIAGEGDRIAMIYDSYILTQGLHDLDLGVQAIDIKAGNGTPIKSPCDCIVTELYTDGIGNSVITLENNRWRIRLLHGKYMVTVGQRVALGSTIGTESNIGNTRDYNGNSCRGRNCGYHSHLEIFDKTVNQNVDPLTLFGIQQ